MRELASVQRSKNITKTKGKPRDCQRNAFCKSSIGGFGYIYEDTVVYKFIQKSRCQLSRTDSIALRDCAVGENCAKKDLLLHVDFLLTSELLFKDSLYANVAINLRMTNH